MPSPACGNGCAPRANGHVSGVLDVSVVVDADGASAAVEGVAELTVERAGVPERDVRDVRATFARVGDAWRLSRAELVEAVTPPR